MGLLITIVLILIIFMCIPAKKPEELLEERQKIHRKQQNIPDDAMCIDYVVPLTSFKYLDKQPCYIYMEDEFIKIVNKPTFKGYERDIKYDLNINHIKYFDEVNEEAFLYYDDGEEVLKLILSREAYEYLLLVIPQKEENSIHPMLETSIEDDLTKEFQENGYAYLFMWSGHLHYIKSLQSSDISDNDIIESFMYLYGLSLREKILPKFDRLVDSRWFLVLSKKYNVNLLTGFENIQKGYIFRKSIFKWLMNKKEFEIIKPTVSPDNTQLFLTVKSLVDSIVIYNEKDKLVNHSELYTLKKNLFSELNWSDAFKKFYEIYTKLYSDIFSFTLSEEQLVLLLKMIDFSEILSEEIHVDNTCFIYSDFCERIKAYVDEGRYMNQKSGLIEMNEDDIEFEYLKLIASNINHLDGKEIIKLLLEVVTVGKEIKEYVEKKNLLNDKNRYLQGDFTKEKAIVEEFKNLSNVQTGLEFEEYLSKLFSRLGYKVETTKASGDQGADLIIYKDGIKTVVQAKFYSSKVGNKAVQEVVSAIAFYDAHNGMVVTNNYYTPSAIELAEANSITLIDGDKLNELIRKVADNIEKVSDKNDVLSEFLWKTFNIGNCFYHNTLTEEFELVELILSGDQFMTIKYSSGEEELLGVLHPRDFKVISQMAGHEDFSLVSIGEFYFGMHKEQIEAVNEFIKVLNSIDVI